MSELNFRIVVVPEEELNPNQRNRLLSQVKDTVKNCGLTAVSAHFALVKKSEEEGYPEIEQLALEVRGKTQSHSSKIQKKYEEFCLKWKNYFNSLPCSYIELYGNDCFVKSKKSHHRLSYESMAFGVLPHNGQFYCYAELDNGRIVSFYHDTRNVVIEYDQFEAIFSYENIRNIFINISNYLPKVYFDLFNPPIIFRVKERNGRLEKHRNLDFSSASDDPIEVILARFSLTHLYNSKIDVDILGRANVLSLTFKHFEDIREVIAQIHNHCSEKSVYYSCISVVSRSKPFDPIIENMHFGCTYLITAILKRNFVAISQTSDIHNKIRRLRSLSQRNPDSLEKALISVLSALDSGKLINFWNAIESQYIYYVSNKDEINFKDYIVPPKCSMIRRITLTPTRQLLWPPEIMYSNRVLRKFDSEYSVRVTFREDNMSRLSFTACYADPGVMESCVKNPMTTGLRIGSREYEFLAWSNSQIRDHGVWMYAEDLQGNSASDIREWMGDFSHIRNVPKYMARMGQCFSQTEDALSVSLHYNLVRTENDIEGGYDYTNIKPYCFTDGIGRISVELASKVHKALGHDKLSSAFQIRYGGYKGMLVIDPTLKSHDIVFRNSMKKFDCPNSDRLEIARTSAPVPLKLNRPFITLLNGLGVRHRMFSRLQENMLKTLTDMLYIEEEAAEFLKSKTPINLYKFDDISKSGIHLTVDPYFKSLLLALHRHYIEKIKMHANIAIDPSKGRNMLGVIDETNTLCYGEVFVQYTKDLSYGETSKETDILEGEVVVTKNPCMHPGDVRKFQAVDVHALHHIVDCIVFPQRGRRPHPNEMSGSDLDGDEYAVLWDPDLIFYSSNMPPAHFPVVQCPDVPYVTVSHMINFIQNYIKNDHVGAIASAHLAHADNHGIHSDECKVTADKFSIAVDFPKTGKSERLESIERPFKYPDFMENPRREMYKSKKALGKMYRVCKDFESENQVTSISYENIKVDPDLVYNGWKKYEKNAIAARNKFNALFCSVLRNYGIKHEAEALSGAFTNLHCRYQERKDRNEIEKVIIGCIKRLNKCMHEEFMEEFSDAKDAVVLDNALLQKASAWYVVTYSDSDAKFLSFPWTVSEYLVQIKLRKTLGDPHPFSPAIMKLDETIVECESKRLLPEYVETRIWSEYNIVCNPRVLRQALKTLILWAQEEEIIARPGYRTQGLLYLDIFVKLFFHVAENQGYVTKKISRANRTAKMYSAGYLCLEFLKFCSTFRFYNKHEIAEILPFHVFKHSKLGKLAIVAYHKFALSCTLQTLNFDKTVEKELILMKPMPIDSKIFSGSPIKESSLKEAEEALINHSKVHELSLREERQTKKVWVTAKGSEESLKELKSTLRKKHVVLRQLFCSGIMPESQ